jgi:manganese oxidase
MNMIRMTRLFAVFGLLALAGADKPARHAVTIDAQGFSPSTIRIDVGDSVVWANRDDKDHSVQAADGSFRSGNVRPGKSFSKTFTKPGTYPYGCQYHPRERGTVVVE